MFESCDTVNITILKQGESADTIIANVAIVYETAKGLMKVFFYCSILMW